MSLGVLHSNLTMNISHQNNDLNESESEIKQTPAQASDEFA